MGFQNGNDNGQMQSNADKNVKSAQRTSTTSKLSNDTTKCQYERLSKSEKGKGE